MGGRPHSLRPLNTASSSPLLPWLLGTLSATLLFAAAVLAWLVQRRKEKRELPLEWSLTSRPVFHADERRLYRQLREALPHHVVLAKLPLVRFCQPTDPRDIRRWARLLGPLHVGFAICSPNGRVLAALDIDRGGGASRRSAQLKQTVLAACRVRYLRCPSDLLPSVPELQLLVPHPGPLDQAPSASRVQATGGFSTARARGARAGAPLWEDSGFATDSWFGPQAEPDAASGGFGVLHAANEFPGPDDFDEAIDAHHDEPHRGWRRSP